MSRQRTTADDVAAFLLREKYAQERQEEWWREQIAAASAKSGRGTLIAVANTLGLADRPPAEWKSKREREIEGLRADIEHEERRLEDMRRRLGERS